LNYAIEIETGKQLKNNKKLLFKKVKILNKTFRKNWFFVVTNRNLTKSYSRFGRTYNKLSIKTKISRLLKKGKNT